MGEILALGNYTETSFQERQRKDANYHLALSLSDTIRGQTASERKSHFHWPPCIRCHLAPIPQVPLEASSFQKRDRKLAFVSLTCSIISVISIFVNHLAFF